MDSQRPFGARSNRAALVDSIPALAIFAGAVAAIVIGIIEPRKLFSLGGVVLLCSAVAGFVVRWVIPGEGERTKGRRSGVQLVIFDCDGVLVDTEAISVEVEARVLTELGWPMPPTEVARRWVGRSAKDQLADIAAELGDEAAALFEQRAAVQTRTAFERSLVPVDGVRPLLDHLDGIELAYCVASSGTHERIRLSLGIAGLMGRFAGKVYSATDVANGKPAPDLFLHAAQQMGAVPETCVVVEDSVYGVEAALTAGMTVYGYAGGLTPARDLAAAGAVVFHDLRDMVALVSPSQDAA